MASVDKKCSICQRELAGDKKKEVTLSCKHAFHRDCATKRLKLSKSSDCPVCRKKDALEHAMKGDLMVSDTHEYFVQCHNSRDPTRKHSSLSSSAVRLHNLLDNSC